MKNQNVFSEKEKLREVSDLDSLEEVAFMDLGTASKLTRGGGGQTWEDPQAKR